jgi:hypothetical protein
MTSKRSKYELSLPGLTPPSRGFARDPSCPAEDPNAEYHGVYTIRGAKIRPGQIVKAWINDVKMDPPAYEAEAIVLGIRHNPASIVPSPFELVLDLLFFSKHKQLRQDAHDYLVKNVDVRFVSDGKDDNALTLINWPGVTWASCVRDTVCVEMVRKDERKPSDGKLFVAAYSELSGEGKSRKIRQARAFPEGCTEADMLAMLPSKLQDILPLTDHYITTASSISNFQDAVLPTVARGSACMIDKLTPGPGTPLLVGCNPAFLLILGVRLQDGRLYFLDLELDETKDGAYRVFMPGELVRARLLNPAQQLGMRTDLRTPDKYARLYYASELDTIPSNQLEQITADEVCPRPAVAEYSSCQI